MILNRMIFLVFLILLSCSVSLVFASKGDISLVTVGESSSGMILGGIADISLEVKAGSGKIFIDSFPFTREDTQVSIRFAKQVACSFLEIDCSRLDFFYSINVRSSFVGGPSAGAAIAILTISVLSGDDLDESVVVTGTINSGGIIGPVSGLREKAVAAREQGFKKILVPRYSVLAKSLEVNSSYDDVNVSSNLTFLYADSLVIEGIEIVPISTLEEALFEFTGKVYPDYSHEIVVSDQYQKIMSEISSLLCNRSVSIIDSVLESVAKNNSDLFNEASVSLERGLNASSSSDYYSSASFCFSANSVLRKLAFMSYSNDSLINLSLELKENISSFMSELDSKNLRTLSDLETYIIVKERLFEAESLLEEENHLANLGYILERYFSAVAWSYFFDFEGKEILLDESHLGSACVSKISEAEERLSYIDFLLGSVYDRSELDEVKLILDRKDYAFCIFRASKVKADANALILSMSLSRDKVSELLNDQLTFARIQINKQGENFPILGYSYYNYAEALRDTRPHLSMIFAEYASEFSALDMYFPFESKTPWFLIFKSWDGFIKGFVIGFFFCVGVLSFIVLVKRFCSKKVCGRKKAKRYLRRRRVS